MSQSAPNGAHTAASLADVLEKDYSLKDGKSLYLAGGEWELVIAALRSEKPAQGMVPIATVIALIEREAAGWHKQNDTVIGNAVGNIAIAFKVMLAAAGKGEG